MPGHAARGTAAARRRLQCCLGLLLANIEPTAGFCPSLDVVFLVDRSSDVGAQDWNSYVMPFISGMIESIDPGGSGSTGTRAGIVVFPARANGVTGDTSGAAEARVQMTYDKATLLDAVDEGTGQCDSNLAANSLRYPCDAWGHRPIWNALAIAEDMLYNTAPSDRTGAAKIVVLVTAGAPSSTHGTKTHDRASYLTLTQAAQLKLKNKPAFVMGVGYGATFGNLGLDCSPFCEDGGEGLFAGHRNSGMVALQAVDSSPLHCNGDGGCGWSNDLYIESLISGGCNNDCFWPSDGECDDGGSGAHYQSCELGSDCVDCGARGEGKTSNFWTLNSAASLLGVLSSVATQACMGSVPPAPKPPPSPPPPSPPSRPPPPPIATGPCAFPGGSGDVRVTDFSVIAEHHAVIESHNHDNAFAIGGTLYSGYSGGMSKTVHGRSWVAGGVSGGGFIFKNGVQTGAGQPFDEKMAQFQSLASVVKQKSFYRNGKQYRVQAWDQGGSYDGSGESYATSYSRGGNDQEEVRCVNRSARAHTARRCLTGALSPRACRTMAAHCAYSEAPEP